MSSVATASRFSRTPSRSRWATSERPASSNRRSLASSSASSSSIARSGTSTGSYGVRICGFSRDSPTYSVRARPCSPRHRLGAMVTDSRTKVLVAGGGVAGLEAILALRAIAPGRFDIELVTPQRHVTSRSLCAGPPFLRATADRVELAAIAAERGVRLTRDALELVEPDLHEVLTQGGARRSYDVLVLALGTRPARSVEGAMAFRGLQDLAAVTAALDTVTSVAYIASLAVDVDRSALRARRADRRPGPRTAGRRSTCSWSPPSASASRFGPAGGGRRRSPGRSGRRAGSPTVTWSSRTGAGSRSTSPSPCRT